VIKTTLILLLGLASVASLRRSSAALRHWVLTVSMVCAALIPAFEAVVPNWHVPVGVALPWRTSEPITLVVPLGPIGILGRTDTIAAGGIIETSGDSVARLLAIVWALGSSISLAVLLVGCARLTWLASRSVKLSEGPSREAANSLCHQFGLVRDIELVQTRHPALLVTWGWLRPRILLPEEARDWPIERVRIVLAHELAHIRRRDWLVQIAAEILRSLYWFNPVVWIACRTLRRQSELACDDVVLGLGVEGPAYATHLLDIARNFRKARRFIDPSFPAPAMARSSSFERRVRAMLNTDRNRMPVSRRVGICTVLALLGITLPVAGLLASSQGVGTTTFSGSVMDAVGRVIPNLTLVLTSRQARTTHETKSDGSGHFAFPGLLPGEYIIEVRKPGFDPVQGRVMLDPGEDLEQDVALQLGSVQETITISTGDTAGPPLPAPPPPAATDRRVAPPPPPPPPPPATAQQPPVDDSCSQAAVGGCIQPPVKLTHVPPQYPARQRDASVEGTVNVEGRIGTDGYLKELRLTAPAEPEFVTATLDALSAWQFAPTRLGGVPVETRIKVTVNFVSR
jgi:TonB family protein